MPGAGSSASVGRPSTSPRENGTMRSWLGEQYDSRKESAPSYRFGTSQRSNIAGAYKLSPGPIYAPGASIGKGPKYGFGTGPGAGAVGSGGSTPRRGVTAPGPGEYESASAIGRTQAASMSKNAPSYGWGTQQRKSGSSGHTGSGPSVFYSLGQSIGPQPESRKKEASSFAFGTQQRFGGTRSTLGREAGAPGPGSYDDRGAAGKQPDSTKVTQPAFGFGTAIRFADQRRALSVGAPGPRYKLGSSLQRQATSERKSAAAYGFGSARRFGGPSVSIGAAPTPGPGAYNA